MKLKVAEAEAECRLRGMVNDSSFNTLNINWELQNKVSYHPFYSMVQNPQSIIFFKNFDAKLPYIQFICKNARF